jgi:hypothetical protein
VGAAFVAHQRGRDPRSCLTADQLAELRSLSRPRRHAFRVGRLVADRIDLPPVTATVAGLGAFGLHWYGVAIGAFACAGVLLAWHVVAVLRARRLRASLRRLLTAPTARRLQFDRVVGEFGQRADIRWAGLVDWRESEMNGSVAFERGVTSGPSELALTSWLTREAEAGSHLLTAGGAELGGDGYHVAVPLKCAIGVVGFLVLVFARRPTHYIEAVLASLGTELAAALQVGTPQVPAALSAVEAAAS